MSTSVSRPPNQLKLGRKVERTLTQRALLQIYQILLDMLRARRPDQHRVPVLALQQAVVRDPAERDLRHRQVVLLRYGLDRGQRAEVGLVPVACTVILRRIRPSELRE